MNHRSSSKWPVVGSTLFILAFTAALVHLLLLRFSAGDVYPPYSTLRTDPLGSKALYESLDICCDFSVSRNHEAFGHVKERFDSAFFVLGLHPRTLAYIPSKTVEQVNYFVQNGGRIIITLLPGKKDEPSFSFDFDQEEKSTNLLESLGLRMFYEAQSLGTAYLDRSYGDRNLPASISIHTAVYFQQVHRDWRTVYHRSRHPVLLERKMGRGSIVISSESYYLSNEALARERQPSLLAWLSGGKKNIIFDEYHHGIAKQRGVMYLARKYQLEWFLGGLLVLALVFVWRSSSPFVPPEQEPSVLLQHGKESVAGLTNLLRRNVPASQLLQVCFQEWKKSSGDITENKTKEMEQILNQEKSKSFRQRNLPAAYNALSRVIKQRR